MDTQEQELLQRVIEFHGHACPGLITGYRVALAARERIGLPRAEDEELVAVVENDSCAVDAVQVILGCTFGKGNLVFRDHGKHVYTFYLRDGSGRALRIRTKRPRLREGLSKEEVMQALLEASEDELLSLSEVEAPPPEPARIEPSVPCARCGEETMESRLRPHGDAKVCIPCLEELIGGSGK